MQHLLSAQLLSLRENAGVIGVASAPTGLKTILPCLELSASFPPKAQSTCYLALRTFGFERCCTFAADRINLKPFFAFFTVMTPPRRCPATRMAVAFRAAVTRK
jgi:hypothetical protein